jgi:23S rRNA (uridine2552-2'-O)-methyltransferase
MAPKTTGIRNTDQARSLQLCELALEIAMTYLKPNGNFACKLFHSDEFAAFRDQLRKVFSKVEIVKPKSTRKISKEIFLVGIRKLAQP